MSNFSYWDECIAEACEDAGVTVSEEQIKIIAGWVDGAHENYGMAHGYDAIPNPLSSEVDELKKNLKREQTKEICKECKGSGREISYGPIHSCESSCWKCHGEGFLYRD